MGKLKTASQRQEYLEAYKASGDSVSHWCERTGIHRTTMYRWLRQEGRTSKTPIKKPEAQAIKPAEIKWLPVTETKVTARAESNWSDKNQAEAWTDARANEEIRVQIGRFTVITPGGFKRDTLETVFQALQSIC